MDVCSLYPFVMLNRDYPTGEIKYTNNFDINSELIGFFECKNIE